MNYPFLKGTAKVIVLFSPPNFFPSFFVFFFKKLFKPTTNHFQRTVIVKSGCKNTYFLFNKTNLLPIIFNVFFGFFLSSYK